MTRKECLDKAAECVLKDRQNQYGKPEDCFGMIARMWGAYLGVCIFAHDVAAMMALLKIARFRHNPFHEDNAVDCAGYAACMVETATAWEREGESKAEGNCFQNGNSSPEFKSGDRVQANIGPNGKWEDMVYYCKDFAGNHLVGVENAVSSGDILYVADAVRPAPKADEEPKFKSGDRVQYRVELPSVSDWIWRDATYLRRAFSWQQDGEHIVTDEKLGPVTVKDKDIRPAPKAEGCEELVEQDAPQTPQELYQHIVDCNPSVYPRKPTGEELAEMAEEDEKHG